METAGIEPASENLFIRFSPGAAGSLHSLAAPPTGGLRGLVSLIHPAGRGTPAERSPLK